MPIDNQPLASDVILSTQVASVGEVNHDNTTDITTGFSTMSAITEAGSTVDETFTFPHIPLGQPVVVDLGIGFGHLEGIQFKIAISLLTIIEVLVIVTNIIVLMTIRRHRQLRTTTSMYIISLAISDLCCGFGMPIGLLAKYIPDIFLHSLYICIMPFCVLLTVLASAVLNLLAVSIDRYIALRNPLRYTAIMTKKRSRIIIISVWIFSFIIGCLPFVWHNKETYIPHSNTGYCQWYRVVKRGYMIMYTVLILSIPIVTIIALYIQIFSIARSHAKSIDSRARVAAPSRAPALPSITDTSNVNTTVSIPQQGILRKKLSDTGSTLSTSSGNLVSKLSYETRVAFTIGMIVLSFVVCWLPLTISLLLGVLGEGKCKVSPEVRGWLGLLALLNSCFDPFIYSIRTKDFRQAFWELLTKAKFRCVNRVCVQRTDENDRENNRVSGYPMVSRGSTANGISISGATFNVTNGNDVGCHTNLKDGSCVVKSCDSVMTLTTERTESNQELNGHVY
ncbi:adenosine receptor A1-like [Lytechinus pictus]|uniref:adenosine receptor A1-like n=1 Tax=Lytechinus pictus TaxID=7653 RepID=UPI0030B9F6DE